ncbi:MAG TPA: Spx/MgsR family RNA polymerase-binding regulatory protein [Planctomycetota bacterium]|jgi:arsenate reductase|nr:Spx/MgsR family RNA polymerase-binding regulatory protein [Planctomycetota bacterium]
MKVYTYKNCSTCRKAVAHLKNAGKEFEEIPIRDTPPTVEELKRMLKALDGDVKALFNRSGQDYRDLNLKDKLPNMSEAEALKLLAGNGNLIRRPFAFIGRNGVVGYDPTVWDNALK